MPPEKPRRRSQIHLSTALVAMIAAGIFVGVNASHVSRYGVEIYGWPCVCEVSYLKYPEMVMTHNWFGLGFCIDFMVVALLTAILIFILEFLMRFRRSFSRFLRDPVWLVELDGRPVAELSQPVEIGDAATSYRVDPLCLNLEDRAAVFRALFYRQNSTRLRYRHIESGTYTPSKPFPTSDAERGSRRVYFTNLVA